MYIATKTNETNTKNKSIKKVRCHCNRKVISMYLSISKFLYFALQIKFRPGQESVKCDQIAALNKNADDFITLPVFLSLHRFKMFITSISSR